MFRILLVLSSFIFSLQAFAFPEAPHKSLDEPLEYVTERNGYDFNGIVALSNCSASVVHFKGQPLSSKAYVLSNGHCLGGFGGFLKPGEVRYKRRDRRSMNVFVDVNNRFRVRSTELIYATMTDTDAALFRINQTYQQLLDKGVASFELASEPAVIGREIQIVSGYWRRGYECAVENYVHELHEADWVMKDSLRYSPTGCDVIGGTSGSPVIAKGERLVVAVNNTMNESGKQCEMNNPCEVDSAGQITILKNRGYAQQTYWFYGCLDSNFEIDLNLATCELPKP
ncbi:MAG: serine protease [Pseudomonadota bacterium]